MLVIAQSRTRSFRTENLSYYYDKAKSLWVIFGMSPETGDAIVVLGCYMYEIRCKRIFSEMIEHLCDDKLKRRPYYMPDDAKLVDF